MFGGFAVTQRMLADVPQIRETIHVRNSGNCLLHRSDDPLHPQPRRPVQSGDLAARQSVRHDRHDHRRAGDGLRAARHVGRLCLDHRRDGRRRQHRPVRRARREDDADAGTGRADAQPGRPRRDAGRLRQLHRSGGLGRIHRRREVDPRNGDLHRHPDRRGDLLRLGDRLRQALRQDRRQAAAAAGAPLAEPRRPAGRDLVRRASSCTPNRSTPA